MTSVRPATLADANDIARVHVRSWRAAYAGMLPQDVLDGLSVERLAQRWEQAIRRAAEPESREIVFVAPGASHEALLGFAHAGPTDEASVDPAAPADQGNTALLHAIYLDDSAWRGGVGTALHEATVNSLRSFGYSRAMLYVIEANERARRFYEARGWHADGSFKTCFGMDVQVDVPTLRYQQQL